MIVNPSYIYYGKSEPLPDFNLWEGGVINVPYTVSNATWFPKQNEFDIYKAGYAEFTVNAKGYSKFRISAHATSIYGGDISVNFYNSAGDLISAFPQKITQNSTSYTFDIPNAARIKNAKIRIGNPTNAITAAVNMATLQE